MPRKRVDAINIGPMTNEEANNIDVSVMHWSHQHIVREMGTFLNKFTDQQTLV